MEYGNLVESLVRQAEEFTGLPVLRVHWYDSAKDAVPDEQQQRIGALPKVKLRLGRFGVDGQQKGVDLRIGLDLVTHARHRAADVFLLVSGDDDLAEAVEEAQVHGVQVIVMAVPNIAGKPHAVARHLVRACDEVTNLDADAIDSAVLKVESVREPAPSPRPVPTPPKPSAVPKPTPKDVAPIRRTEPAPASRLAYTGVTGG